MSQSVSNPTPNADVVDSRSLSPEDIFKELQSGDDIDSLDLTTPIPPKKDKKEEKDEKELESKDGKEVEEEEVEEEEDELSELERELEEPEDVDLEDAVPVSRREILKQFPDLFKKIPYLEKAYYREQQYTKVFANPKDAETAAESVITFNNFSVDMIENGNTKNVLKMIKENNEDTFHNVVDNYLENLAQVDEKAYNHVVGNVIKTAIQGMVNEARSSGDDDLRIAAGLLNKFVFGTTKYIPPQKLGKAPVEGDRKKEEELSQKEKDFNKRQLDTANNEITSGVDSTIKAAVEKHIDPRGVMTDYVKRNAVRDAIDKVKSLMDKDTRLTKLVDKLREKMVESNYSKQTKDDIKKAYLTRARSLLVPVLKSARNEALRGMGKRVKDDIEDTDTGNTPERQKVQKPNERSPSSGNKSRTNLDSVKGMNTLDALNALMKD